MTTTRLPLTVLVSLGLTLAACTTSTSAPSTSPTSSTATSTTTQASTTTTRPRTTTTTTETSVVSTAAACHASQLSVGGFGITGVSFTGVITIRIENTSSSPCSLRGYPVVTFLGNARSRFDPASYPAHLLRVTEGHTRFFGAMTRVVLPPGRAASAGFVITSDGDEGSAICPTATAIRVRLPDTDAWFRVGTAIQVPGIMMCAPGNAVSISPIVRGAVLAVSPQVTVPTTTTTAPARTAQ
jgi:hypothetical protein